MKFQFITHTQMKPYNNNKYWIDSKIIPRTVIHAENVEKALKGYQNIVSDKHYVEISNNAIKNKHPIYYDDIDGNAIQDGYIITAKTEIENTAQYIELWISIEILKNPFINKGDKI